MEFKYRYVGFGTRFTGAEALHDNELAVDVGGVCWGHGGEERAILDHHFSREAGQFPSAAAAVLHNAGRIHQRFHGCQGPLWLVSHRNPDFDAFAALYLARALLRGDIPADGWERLGIHPDGWLPAAVPGGQARKIDWFRPDVKGLPPEQRWPVLLAAYASCVDNCKRLFCPRTGALHAVLYAALERGRDYHSATSGAVEFFDAVREGLLQDRNPLYDSVLEGDVRFAPELNLLAREEEAYRRDVKNARRTLVYLKKAAWDAERWYGPLKATPLVDDQLVPRSDQLELPGHDYQQADAIFLRDPESLLFKEWARADTENASMGQGFLFTAVAYTGNRSGPGRNNTDYVFALDPERANGAHLYNVWVRLQTAELSALHRPENTRVKAEWDRQDAAPRQGFEGRAAGPYRRYFADPWFDGGNYQCTILGTPNTGTVLPAGASRDLSDDEVARLVEEELETQLYTSGVQVQDLSAAPEHEHRKETTTPIRGPAGPARPGEQAEDYSYYRFARVALHEQVEIRKGGMAEQIGRALWCTLHPHGGLDVPPDFRERHLVYAADWVGVWSRRGVAVAYLPAAARRVDEFKRLVAELAALSREKMALIKLMRLPPGKGPAAAEDRLAAPSEEVLKKGEELLLRVAAINHDLALPDNRLVSRFFEASGLTEVLRTLRDVYLAANQKSQTETLNRNISEMTDIQRGLHLVEVFVVSVYAVDLGHLVGTAFHFGHAYMGIALLVIAVLVMGIAWILMHAPGHGKMGGAKLRLALAAGVVVLAAYLVLGFLVRPAESGEQHTGADAQPGEVKRHYTQRGER